MKKTYLLMLLLLTGFFVSAQSPGGISTSLSLWVKSTTNVSTTGGLVDSWGYANNAFTFTSTGGNRPTLTPSVINFNPSVQFTGGAKYMDGPTSFSSPIPKFDDDYTVFAVWKSNSNNTFQRVWSQRSTCNTCNDAFSLSTWDGSAPGPGVYGDETGTPPFYHTIQRPYTANVWNISQLNLYNQATNDLEITDDRNLSTSPAVFNTDPSGTPNGGLLRVIDDAVNRIGANYDGGTPLNGDIAEIIVYNGFPIYVASERTKIFSYLALKYGISIKTDLLSSAGTTIWSATTNSSYNNSVFGLGLDNGSGLSVTQSNSIDNGSGNGTGQNAKCNVVLSNASSLNDQDFLLIGNDNGALTDPVSADVPSVAAGSNRLGREWKVQHTGNIGTITAAIDLTGLTLTGSPLNFRLIVDQDGDGDFTTGTVRFYSPASYAGNIVTFNNLTLNNGEVFALITKLQGIILPVNFESLTAKKVNEKAQLDWVTGNNESGKLFEIEYSLDGINFNKVGVVNNQANIKAYSFIYPSLKSGINYFRIRQVDLDGRAYYSKIITVKGPDITLSLLSNPVQKTYAEVEISSIRQTDVVIDLSSVSGAKLSTLKTVINPGINTVRIPMDKAAPGSYILRLQNGDIILNQRLLKL